MTNTHQTGSDDRARVMVRPTKGDTMFTDPEWSDLKRRHAEALRCQVCGAPATIAGTLCGPCSRWAYLVELARYDRIAARQGRLQENRRRKAYHAALDMIAR